MTKQKLDSQISKLLAVQSVLLESSLLLTSKLDKMLVGIGCYYKQEAKMHYNNINKNIKALVKELEYFEEEIFPAAITSDGKSDLMSVYDALVKDGYDFAKVACLYYNVKVANDKGIQHLEELFNKIGIMDGDKFIAPEIINSLKLNED